MRKFNLGLMVLLIIVFGAAPLQATEKKFAPAVIVKKANPYFPHARKPLDKGTRLAKFTKFEVGLVELIFMVSKDGNPYEISVTGSTSSDFEKEAIRAVARYKYKAAILG